MSRGDVGEFGDVGVAAKADVALDGLHLEGFDVGDGSHWSRLPWSMRARLTWLDLRETMGSRRRRGGGGEQGGEGVGDVDGFDEDGFAGLEGAGVVDEDIGEFGVAGIGHGYFGLRKGNRDMLFFTRPPKGGTPERRCTRPPKGGTPERDFRTMAHGGRV